MLLSLSAHTQSAERTNKVSIRFTLSSECNLSICNLSSICNLLFHLCFFISAFHHFPGTQLSRNCEMIGVTCSNCKRSFRSQQSLGSHAGFCSRKRVTKTRSEPANDHTAAAADVGDFPDLSEYFEVAILSICLLFLGILSKILRIIYLIPSNQFCTGTNRRTDEYNSTHELAIAKLLQRKRGI